MRHKECSFQGKLSSQDSYDPDGRGRNAKLVVFCYFVFSCVMACPGGPFSLLLRRIHTHRIHTHTNSQSPKPQPPLAHSSFTLPMFQKPAAGQKSFFRSGYFVSSIFFLNSILFTTYPPPPPLAKIATLG